jgi:hypothetical protein
MKQVQQIIPILPKNDGSKQPQMLDNPFTATGKPTYKNPSAVIHIPNDKKIDLKVY